MSELVAVVLLALLGSVIALVGGLVFLYNKAWSEVLEQYSVPFAAGVLLAVALLGLMPEAVEAIGEGAFGIVLGAFLAGYLFEHFLFGIHHHGGHDHGRSEDGAVALVIVGDTIHNFVDGVAIAAAYMVAPGLGLVTAISAFLHEVPHEVGDFGILLRAGWSKQRVVWVNAVSSLATVVGALVVVFLGHDMGLVGWLLAAAAGVFLYLGASDFLPQIGEGQDKPARGVMALLAGVLVMVVVFGLVPHG